MRLMHSGSAITKQKNDAFYESSNVRMLQLFNMDIIDCGRQKLRRQQQGNAGALTKCRTWSIFEVDCNRNPAVAI